MVSGIPFVGKDPCTCGEYQQNGRPRVDGCTLAVLTLSCRREVRDGEEKGEGVLVVLASTSSS